MKTFLTHLIILSLGQAFLSTDLSHALDPDFYRQKKIKKDLKKERERLAHLLKREREKRFSQKKKQAIGYSKVRRKMELDKEKRDKLLVKDLQDKKRFRDRKINQALKSAKLKRNKSQVSWQEEGVEYDISPPKVLKK